MALFTYNEIKVLLNSQSKTFLSTEANYTAMADQADKAIADKSGIDVTAEAPDWAQMPYAWLLDYFSSNVAANVSEGMLQRTRENYKLAVEACIVHKSTDSPTTARVGTIEVPYE
jgi:hypothetical protein